MSRSATPLPRRRVDRLQGGATLVLVLAGFVVLLAGGVAGIVLHAREAERSVDERAVRTEVAAVLLVDAKHSDTEYAASALPVRVDATWMTADGQAVTGKVPVPAGTAAGTVVSIWLDAGGRPIAAPVSAAQAGMAGVLGTFSVLAVGGLGIAGLALLVRRLATAGTELYWERE
jgi:hypothetical protein